MANFFIRKGAANEFAKLYLQIQRTGLRFVLCTGIVVNVKDWEKSQKSISALGKYKRTADGAKVIEQTEKITQTVDDLFRSHEIKTAEDKKKLTDAFSAIVNADAIKAKEDALKAQREAKSSITGFYDFFMNGISEGSILWGGTVKREYRTGTVTNWRHFGVSLMEFLKKYPADMTFDDIDKMFVDDFTTFLKKGKNYMPKTVNKTVICFRRLCNAAAEYGYNHNAVSLKAWGEGEVKDSDKRAEVYLTDEELDAFYSMPLVGIEAQARDIFMLGYFTAQRFGDYNNLSRDNFTYTRKGTPVVTLTQQKTGTNVTVPITDDRVFRICERYDYRFPRMKEYAMNKALKTALKRLSETVPSLTVKYVSAMTLKEKEREKLYKTLSKRIRDGKPMTRFQRMDYDNLHGYSIEHGNKDNGLVFERNAKGDAIRPKYELISTHTARRSGATNMYKTGLFDTREMMSVTGHLSEKVFEKYIKVGKSEQADRIAEKIRQAKVIKMAE